MNLYFAYGSNLDAAQIGRRCGGSVLDSRARAAGYALAFGGHSYTWDGSVATMVRAASANIEGLLYQVTREDIDALDGFEGHPYVYERTTIKVRDEHGATRKAIAYIMPEGSYEFGRPSDTYYGVIRTAYEAHGFDLNALDRAAKR